MKWCHGTEISARRPSILSSGLVSDQPLESTVRRHKLTSRLFCALLLAPLLVHSYEPERARENLASEAAECSAYFMLISGLPGVDAPISGKAREAFSELLKISVALSSEKLTKARLELASEGLFRDLDGKGSNIAIVNNKYGYRCADLLNNPESRLKYWLEKK
jgi:hypothetical protein